MVPALDPISLVARYERVRRPRHATGKPRARVCAFAHHAGRRRGGDQRADGRRQTALSTTRKSFSWGRSKNYELFAGDPRIRHAPVAYPRGGLANRLSVWDELKTLLAGDDCLVIDPDSRLTQLGLLAVCPEERYHFFESRAYGADTNHSLPELAAAWAAESFGVNGRQTVPGAGAPGTRAAGISR